MVKEVDSVEGRNSTFRTALVSPYPPILQLCTKYPNISSENILATVKGSVWNNLHDHAVVKFPAVYQEAHKLGRLTAACALSVHDAFANRAWISPRTLGKELGLKGSGV